MLTEAIEWLALRRVHEGSVTKLGGHCFRRGQLVGYLARGWPMSSDRPDVVTAKKLLDELTARGFRFQRTTTGGEDGPLLGIRVTDQWVDTVFVEGVSRDGLAWRQRRRSLLIPGANVTGLVERRIGGGALTVLGEVLTWDTAS